jgi:CRISPR/Cas system-associated exonuclease Cas4 (RecB family)
VGTLVHKALQLMLAEGITTDEALQKSFEGQDWEVYKRAQVLLEKFNLPPEGLVGLEMKFELPLGNHTLTGIMDRVENQNGQTVITDYKTSFYIPPRDEMENDLQPAIYLLANPGALFRYYYLAYGAIVNIAKGPDEAIKDYLIRLADYMEKDEDCPPKLNKFCSYCQFHHTCDLFLNSYLNCGVDDTIDEWERVKQARKSLETREEELKGLILARIAQEGKIEHNGKTYYAEPRKRREYDFAKILPTLQEKNLLSACYVKVSELPLDPEIKALLSGAERINYTSMEIKTCEEVK